MVLDEVEVVNDGGGVMVLGEVEVVNDGGGVMVLCEVEVSNVGVILVIGSAYMTMYEGRGSIHCGTAYLYFLRVSSF